MIVKRKNRRGQDEEVTIGLQRSWSPLINFLQTEDPTLYGTAPKPIRHYWGRDNSASMMLWAVSSAIAGCKELHSAIDKKSLPFRHNGWAGHMLAHVHHSCMKHENNHRPRLSPFNPASTNKFLLKSLETYMPPIMRGYDGTADEDPECYYRFNMQYWRNPFLP